MIRFSSLRVFAGTILLNCGLTFAASHPSVSYQNNSVPDAEICRFAAGSAANPLSRFFFSSDVKCEPAARFVPPPGLWNTFARAGSDLITRSVFLLQEKNIDYVLSPGGRVDVSKMNLEKEETLFFYVPATASMFPLVDFNSPAIVPANVIVVPFLVRRGEVLAVGDSFSVQTGKSFSLTPFEVDSYNGVLTWISFEGPLPTSPKPPVVIVRDLQRKKMLPSQFAVSSVELGSMPLLFFQAPKISEFELAVSGPDWLPEQLESVTNDKKIRVLGPLLARAASELVVFWSTLEDLRELHALQLKKCDLSASADSFPKSLTVDLLGCPGLQLGMKPDEVAVQACNAVQQQNASIEQQKGEIRFSGLSSGTYLLRLVYGQLPPLRRVVSVSPGENRFEAAFSFVKVFGKVSLGRQPAHAQVLFRGGRAVTDPNTGLYEAVLERDPGALPVRIRTCDGQVSHALILNRSPLEQLPLDIVIPANRLQVLVLDSVTGQPITNAEIGLSYRRRADDEIVAYSTLAGETDAAGMISIRGINSEQFVRVIANKDGYERHGSPPFQLGPEETQELRIQLKRKAIRRGRLESASPSSRAGAIWWYFPTGRVSERTAVARDGTFTFSKDHSQEELIFFSGEELPLCYLRPSSVVPGEELVLVFPIAASASFEVRLSNNAASRHMFTVQIGGIPIPWGVLSEHLLRFGYQPVAVPGGALPVRNIAQTGEIVVISAPMDLLERISIPGADPFYMPEAGSFVRARVTSGQALIP